MELIRRFCSSISGKVKDDNLKICCSAFAKSVSALLSFTDLQECESGNHCDELVLYTSFLCAELISMNEEEKTKFLVRLFFNRVGKGMVSPSYYAEVVARVLMSDENRWALVSEQVLNVLTIEVAREVEEDVEVASSGSLEKCLLLIRYALSTEEVKGRNLLAEQILPLLLGFVGSSVVPFSRKELIAPIIHLFYFEKDVLHMELFWKAVTDSGILGLQLLCRCIGPLKGERLLSLLKTEGYWTFIHRWCEESVRNKNAAASLARQAQYCLRESVSASIGLNLEGCYFKGIVSKDIVADFDEWMNLFESLDQFTLHLLEPVWPVFEKICKRRNLTKIWLQLIFQKALLSDTRKNLSKIICLF